MSVQVFTPSRRFLEINIGERGETVRRQPERILGQHPRAQRPVRRLQAKRGREAAHVADIELRRDRLGLGRRMPAGPRITPMPAHDRAGGVHPELAVKHLELLDIIKEYEVGKGDYSKLDPEEFEAVAIES